MRQLRACLGTTLGAANRRRSLPPAADGKRLGWALKRLGAAIVFGVIAAPQPVSAMCFPYPLPGYLQELEVASCTPVDEDAQASHRPRHTGGRFSLNALMPSFASSLMKTLAE